MRRIAPALVHLGVAGVILGLGKYHASAIGDYDLTSSARFAWLLTFIAVTSVTAYAVGIPDLARSPRVAAASGAVAAGAGALVISVFQLVLGSSLLPRFVVLGTPLLLVPWFIATAVFAQGGRSRDEDRDRVVLVSSGAEAEVLADELDRAPERPAQVVATLSPEAAGARPPYGRPLVEEVVHRGATVVVLDRAAQADESVVAQAAVLHGAGVRVRTLSLFYEQWLGKLPVAELERVSLLFDIGEVHRVRYTRAKRLFDVAFAVAGAIVLAAVVPAVLVGNAVANRGPLFYRQPRVGRDRIFDILKFRTMRADNGVADGAWTRAHDPRVTPFGRVLRRTHLDELPQVVNVLRGDLTIVGPRPEQPQYVAELLTKIPFYDTRHLVRPGLTGWAQVKYPYGGSESDALEKLQYEFFYLRRQGIGLDLRIVGRTIRSVLRGEGR